MWGSGPVCGELNQFFDELRGQREAEKHAELIKRAAEFVDKYLVEAIAEKSVVVVDTWPFGGNSPVSCCGCRAPSNCAGMGYCAQQVSRLYGLI